MATLPPPAACGAAPGRGVHRRGAAQKIPAAPEHVGEANQAGAQRELLGQEGAEIGQQSEPADGTQHRNAVETQGGTVAQERPVRRQDRLERSRSLGEARHGAARRPPPGRSDHGDAGGDERQPPAGEGGDGGQDRHADDRRARHAGGRPPESPASLRAGKVRAGDGQRRTKHRRIGQAARQGANEEHGEGRSQAKGEKTDRGRNETEEDHATVAIAVGQRTGDQPDRGTDEQHRRHDLTQQRHADVQITRHDREERRRGDEREHGHEHAETQGRQDPAVGSGAAASRLAGPVRPWRPPQPPRLLPSWLMARPVPSRAESTLISTPSCGGPGQNLDRSVTALHDQAFAVPP